MIPGSYLRRLSPPASRWPTCRGLSVLTLSIWSFSRCKCIFQSGVPDVFFCRTFKQFVLQEAGDKPNVVVATFETSALELLFPFPQLRGPYCAGVDVDLLMEPTRDFPGIIAPKVITNKKRNKIRLLCCQHAFQSAPY